MTEWERDFVANVGRRSSLTPRQSAKLAEIRGRYGH